MSVSHPALRYHGAKWRLADWLIGHFPPHVCYVEPFVGGAGVFLRKPPSPLEVLNDADGEIVNFWRVLRDQPQDLIRAIDLTPFSRCELEDAKEPTDDPVERARRFYVLSWQCIHGVPKASTSGWRLMRSLDTRSLPPVGEWSRTAHLWGIASRLKMAQIEDADALTVIPRYDTPETVTYCDPPYTSDTRSTRWRHVAYGHEMTEDDHRRLAEVLRACKGAVLLSGYDSPLYQDLYRGWERRARATTAQSGAAATEVLWLNTAAASAVRQRPLPMEMVAS